jgi:hypothetical protein
MGLAERRAAKAFQDTRLPPLQAAIDAAAGFAVKLEVDWESLSVADYAHLYDEAWTKVYFQPLTEAFSAITIDEMGKEALKESLTKVAIKNEGSSWPEFEAGVLTLKFPAVSNLDEIQERARSIQQLLEKSL